LEKIIFYSLIIKWHDEKLKKSKRSTFRIYELPADFIQAIHYSTLNFRIHCDGCGYDATDEDKLNWFKFANFA
jgi:hypothetical protein